MSIKDIDSSSSSQIIRQISRASSRQLRSRLSAPPRPTQTTASPTPPGNHRAARMDQTRGSQPWRASRCRSAPREGEFRRRGPSNRSIGACRALPLFLRTGYLAGGQPGGVWTVGMWGGLQACGLQRMYGRTTGLAESSLETTLQDLRAPLVRPGSLGRWARPRAARECRQDQIAVLRV